MTAQKRPTYLQKRAVVLEPDEKRAIALLQQMRALRKDQVSRRKEKQAERKAEHHKKVEKTEERKEERRKLERKDLMRTIGLRAKRKADEGDGGSSRKRQRT